ncbi:hypothetical protein Bca4012_056387 [Brassica carinata]
MAERRMLTDFFAKRSHYGTPILGILFSASGAEFLSWQEISQIDHQFYLADGEQATLRSVFSASGVVLFSWLWFQEIVAAEHLVYSFYNLKKKMNGVSRHLRASSLPSLIRGNGGIQSICQFSSQSDGFSGGRSTEQGPVPGDSEKKPGLPDPNASPFKRFSEIKAGLSNTRGNTFGTFSDMRSGLSPNAPPTFKNPLRSCLPNTLPDQLNQQGLPSTGGSGFPSPSAPSYQSFPQSSLLKDNFRSAAAEQHFCHGHRFKATSSSLPDLKGGRKMTSYTADATAENIGRRVKAMGLKSVVVKVNGFTHFKKKRNAIVAFRSGYSNSRNDPNPIVYIEDTTRKAHNGCRLPKKRRNKQQPLLPDPSHSLQVNPFGLLSSSIHDVADPYPLALYGLNPALPTQPVYYKQLTGYGGYGLRPTSLTILISPSISNISSI